jgi:tetratricopeptide (TPR) repeat protein
MVRNISDPPPSASTAGEQLRYFTNREDEKKVFQRCLDISQGSPLPVLNFYGVGGGGKTSLCKHLQQIAQQIALPSAMLDFDSKSGGNPHLRDSVFSLAYLREQLDVSCPSFDVAYSMLRFKEGRTNEPAIKGHGVVSDSFDFLLEFGQAVTSSLPGGNVVAWIARKVSKPAWEKVRETALGKWLETTAGNADLISLRQKDKQAIYPELNDRLLRDLREQLPPREGRACRGVIFLDTFEAIREGVNHVAEEHRREEWVREFYRPDSGLLMVIFGRDRLRWEEVDEDFKDIKYLETHRMGGLSRADALIFLGKCGITEGSLQEAILRVCREQSSHADAVPDGPQKAGYHPFSLGLCVDTVQNERRQGRQADPASFSIAANDSNSLAQRFLQSLQGPEKTQCELLALTPRFDQLAAMAASNGFSPIPMSRSESHARWSLFIGQSFVSQVSDGWYTLHAVMRQTLQAYAAKDTVGFTKADEDWRDYWVSRSTSKDDEMASLAWYHGYRLNPVEALEEWTDLAQTARMGCRMIDHFRLLGWWRGVEPSEMLTQEQLAAELSVKGFEATNATVGNPARTLSEAIEFLNAVLRARTEQDFPVDWAGTQINLGNAYSHLPTGDAAENLRQAADRYKNALRIFTEKDFPVEWAMTQNNLGIIYSDLPNGDRADNVRRATNYYLAALRVFTEKDFPVEWARTQNNLGSAHWKSPSGDRAENVGRAIECYKAALCVCTERDFPAEWARIQNNLGVTYSDLSSGERIENLLHAIDCYKALLRVYSERDFPVEWATAQNNLGNSYCQFPTGDRAENLQQAIDYYNAALRVCTEQDFPVVWGMTQHNLGVAYRDLLSSNRAENLRRAIGCFIAALRVRTEADFPVDWAMTQVNLGTAYCRLPMGDWAEALRHAIDCFSGALRVYSEQEFPAEWATTQKHLGDAYSNISTDDRGENVRQAIECYNAALQVYTERDFPLEWAGTQNMLGLVCSELTIGDRAGNLRRAIDCYTAVLRVYTEQNYPADWAMTQSNLGNAYLAFPTGDRARNLTEAKKCFELAVGIYRSLGMSNDADKAQAELDRLAIAGESSIAAQT